MARRHEQQRMERLHPAGYFQVIWRDRIIPTVLRNALMSDDAALNARLHLAAIDRAMIETHKLLTESIREAAEQNRLGAEASRSHWGDFALPFAAGAAGGVAVILTDMILRASELP
jgi:hypothetical protein